MKRWSELGSTVGRWPKMGEAAFEWANEWIATVYQSVYFRSFSIRPPEREANRTYVVVHGVLVKHYNWSAIALYDVIDPS